MDYIEKEEPEFVESIIKKYSQISPIKNNVLEIPINGTNYKLVRLNDEQFAMLGENSVPISDDYGFLMTLSRLDIIYDSYAKMYVTLKSLFGESGEYYDDWKGAFSFPFLIHFEKSGVGYDYLMNVFTMRSSIEFGTAKLIRADNTKLRRDVEHKPFKEFTITEINRFVSNFLGFLNGYCNFFIEKNYNDDFFKTIDSQHIIFGYKDGEFFEEQYDSGKRFKKEINAMKKYLKNK
jgi:hypothetical protein